MNDEEPDHGYSSPSSRLVSLPLVHVLGNNDSDDNMAGSHPEGADSKHRLATNTVNPQHGRNRCDEHDNAYYTRSQERGCVAAQSKLLEDLRGVVENRIDAGPLLEEHGYGRHDNASEHCFCPEELLYGDKLELKGIPGSLLAQFGKQLGNAAFFKERLGLNLEELELDKLVVLG